MNLKILFNKNYFLENLKKSKGILAFLFGIVPLFNILFLIICVVEKERLMNFGLISMITLLGMYVIPIGLSIALFGFVFKKKSVDFVMSKPISRKTMYFTNVFGGILVLVLFMLLNTIIFGIFGILFDFLVIPFGLLVDYFIFYLISYLFMFLATMLAVTLAGNFITSMVVVAIIVLIYPFFCLTGVILTNNHSIGYIQCEEETCMPTVYNCYSSDCKDRLTQNEYAFYMDRTVDFNFTTPTLVFLRSGDHLYSTKALVKMLVLSGVYLVIGAFTFKNRKMEDNETDFRSDFKHYLVKTITFMPVCLISYVFLNDFEIAGILIGITIAIVYYIVYDLIVKKEIYRLGRSLLICIISLVVLCGCFAFIHHLDIAKTVRVQDITSIEISYEDTTLSITDKNLINEMIKSDLSNPVDAISYCDVQLKANHKTYRSNCLAIDSSLASKIDALATEATKQAILEFNYDKIDYIEYEDSKIPVTKELIKLLKKASSSSFTTGDLKLYHYQNHEYKKISIPIHASEELYSYIIRYMNEAAIKVLKSNNYISVIYTQNSVLNELDEYLFDYVINSNFSSFLNYVKKMDITNEEDSFAIHFYCENQEYTLTIHDIAKFQQEFKEYKQKLELNQEYQDLVSEYQEYIDGEAYEY